RDAQNRLIDCQHTNRRIVRFEPDGTITVLADKYEGKRFNSPNDVVVKHDGSIWFTDPPYGLPKDQKRELDKNYIFVFDPQTQKIGIAADDIERPNGLCFSPDEKRLYAVEGGGITVYDVSVNALSNG